MQNNEKKNEKSHEMNIKTDNESESMESKWFRNKISKGKTNGQRSRQSIEARSHRNESSKRNNSKIITSARDFSNSNHDIKIAHMKDKF